MRWAHGRESTPARQEFNQAFVLMQYFGYLRRDANTGPDALNAIKEQQKEIAELKGQVRQLQAASRRRRK